MRSLILEDYVEEYAKLRQDIEDNAVGRISLTYDIWTAKALRPFLAATAHWIKRHPDGSLSLEANLLSFHHLPGHHTGERIASALVEILDFFNITNKVGHITSDNASNNGTATVALQSILTARGIAFDPEYHRVRCFPHIVHLAVTALLSAATTLDDTHDRLGGQQRSASTRDVISLARDLVRSVSL